MHRGARYLTRENLKVLWAEFSKHEYMTLLELKTRPRVRTQACTGKQKVQACSKRSSFSQSVRMRDYYYYRMRMVSVKCWKKNF